MTQDMLCAPVAVINAVRWAGGLCTLEDDLERLAKDMECTEKGVDLSEIDFERFLMQEAGDLLTVRKSTSPTIPEIEEHLSEGGAVLLAYGWIDQEVNKRGSHATLYTEVMPSGKHFVCAERDALVGTGRYMLISRKELRHDLRKRTGNDDLVLPIAWFLEKTSELERIAGAFGRAGG